MPRLASQHWRCWCRAGTTTWIAKGWRAPTEPRHSFRTSSYCLTRPAMIGFNMNSVFYRLPKWSSLSGSVAMRLWRKRSICTLFVVDAHHIGCATVDACRHPISTCLSPLMCCRGGQRAHAQRLRLSPSAMAGRWRDCVNDGHPFIGQAGAVSFPHQALELREQAVARAGRRSGPTPC